MLATFVENKCWRGQKSEISFGKILLVEPSTPNSTVSLMYTNRLFQVDMDFLAPMLLDLHLAILFKMGGFNTQFYCFQAIALR